MTAPETETGTASKPALSTRYETVVGLEVHVQLKTNAKLFCPDSTHFGDDPNMNACPVCLGYPGVLPVLNQQAVEYAVMLGLALNCQIAELSKFDRKHYFYPDLPKGYQISQYDKPVCEHGHMMLSNGRKIRILRAHLEEDAGKLVHAGADGLAGSTHSLSDLNRAGTPLLEIVTEPDFRSAEEAREYLNNLRNIVRYLGVCDGNMEEGSMRCDANVSIRPIDSNELGTKTEVKNMNSTRAVQRAIEVEASRQAALLDAGERVRQETRLWNEATGKTVLMRSKEEAHDYRYFPEPDLRPLKLELTWINGIKSRLPELPHQRLERMQSKYTLSDYDAGILVEFKELGDFFDAVAKHTQNYKAVINLLQGDITGYLKTEKKSLEQTHLTPEMLAELVKLLDEGIISSAITKKLIPELMESGGSPRKIVEDRGMAQVSDEGAIKAVVEKIIAANPDQVEKYRGGKQQLFGFFVGQVMKESKGSANPELVNKLLKDLL